MESLKHQRDDFPWIVCGVLLLATLLNYMDRQALAVTLPTLKQKFQLTESRVGMIEGSFGIAFAVGSIIFGWIADRTGPRWLYPVVLAGWSLAGIATSWAGQPWIESWLATPADPPGTAVYHWLLLCRVALGICEAGHWPCALLTVRAILNPNERTLGNGILQSGASIGAILVPLYVEAADRAGQPWQFPFWSIGIAGLAWVPLWLTFTRRLPLAPAPKPALSASEAVTNESMTNNRQWTGESVRRLVVLAIIVATLTISWQFLRAWLALFLQDHHGYSKQATRGLMSGYFIAADVGCILSGVLVTRLTRQGWGINAARKFGYLLFTMLTACGALIPYAPDGWPMIGLLFLTGAGILGLHPFYYALTQDLVHHRMGVLSGFLAAGGWIVSSLSQIYLGRHIEATKSYELGLLVVGLAPTIGLIALWTLWPRDPSPTAAR